MRNVQVASRRQFQSSESVLKNPVALFLEMVRETIASLDTARMLAVRDIKAEYRQSVLGIFWAFVPPILIAVGLTYARRSNVLQMGQTEIPFAAYVIIGMAFWQTFVAAVNGPMRGLNAARGMLCRVYFPRETVIVAEFLKVCFFFGFQLVLLVAVFLWFRLPVTFGILAVIPALLILIAFGIAIGTLIAPIGLLFRDVGNALTPALSLWMILTPVFYPEPTAPGVFKTIVSLNPVTPLIMTLRQLTVGESLTHGMQFALWIPGIVVFIFFVGLYFRVCMPIVIERWSS